MGLHVEATSLCPLSIHLMHLVDCGDYPVSPSQMENLYGVTDCQGYQDCKLDQPEKCADCKLVSLAAARRRSSGPATASSACPASAL